MVHTTSCRESFTHPPSCWHIVTTGTGARRCPLILGPGVPVQTVVTHTHRAVYALSLLVLGQGGVPVQTVVNHLHTHRAVYTRSPLVQGQGGNPLIPSALKYAVKDLGDNAGSIHEKCRAQGCSWREKYMNLHMNLQNTTDGWMKPQMPGIYLWICIWHCWQTLVGWGTKGGEGKDGVGRSEGRVVWSGVGGGRKWTVSGVLVPRVKVWHPCTKIAFFQKDSKSCIQAKCWTDHKQTPNKTTTSCACTYSGTASSAMASD